jgi:lysophospholipase L1-like esterase
MRDNSEIAANIRSQLCRRPICRVRVLFVYFLTLLVSSLAVGNKLLCELHWVESWGAAQQELDKTDSPPSLNDATIRQIVHLSMGGSRLRIRLSNVFGEAPLRIDSVHIARPMSPKGSAIDAATDTVIRFDGQTSLSIPAGSEYVSDAACFEAASLSDLAVTIHITEAPARRTGHSESLATSYVNPGTPTSAPDLPRAKSIDHWFFLAGAQVSANTDAGSIVILGDSITDGHASNPNENRRWPDQLARRIKAASLDRRLAVVNTGIGGNRLLLDGLGPNALARFDRDVLSRASVRYLIILEGVNDLGTSALSGEASKDEHARLVHRIISAYAQMVTRAHAHNIKVLGATLLPYAGTPYYVTDASTEADRRAINNWIKFRGHLDAVIDFDQVMCDVDRRARLSPKYDSGDHIHPSSSGYTAMGDAVALELFYPTRP